MFRLNLLLELLRNSPSPKKKDLIKELGVDERTFFRYLKFLKKQLGWPIFWDGQAGCYVLRGPPKVGADPTGVAPRADPFNTGGPLTICLRQVNRDLEQYGRIGRQFVSTRGMYARKCCVILERLLTRCLTILVPAASNFKMEAQVRLLEKRNEELTALIKQKLPHCIIGSMLLSSKDLELLGEVQELRNRCIRQNASALAQQQTQALRLDDLRHKLRALCKSNFLQSVAAVERWKDELQTTEHSGVVE